MSAEQGIETPGMYFFPENDGDSLWTRTQVVHHILQEAFRDQGITFTFKDLGDIPGRRQRVRRIFGPSEPMVDLFDKITRTGLDRMYSTYRYGEDPKDRDARLREFMTQEIDISLP